MRVLDLFSGAGGFSLGFEQSGDEVIAGVDFDEKAIETWRLNHDGVGIVGDLSGPADSFWEDQEGTLLDGTPLSEIDPDVIIGGPPCQDFSKANQRLNLDRQNLVFNFLDHIVYLQPKAFVMENVRQLLTKDDGQVLKTFEGIAKAEGYVVAHRLLDAADYGVPQHRIRAFVIGIRADCLDGDVVRFPRPTHGPDSNWIPSLRTAWEALADLDPEVTDLHRVKSKHAPLLDDIPPGMNYSFYTEKMGHPEPRFEWRSRFSDFLYKADPDKPVKTIKASPGSTTGPFHWDNRQFTVEELKRLQSFPDDFDIPWGLVEAQKQIGNSVPPRMATAIALAVREQAFADVDDAPWISLLDPEETLGFNGRRRTSSAEYLEKATKQIQRLYG